jgi:two-component system cell cycle sensor histidine kinase/response regulator CckA
VGTLGISRDITELKRVEKRIKHMNDVLYAIRNLHQLITSERNRDKFIQKACKKLIEIRSHNTAWIILFNESGELVSTAKAGIGDKFKNLTKRIKDGDYPNCIQSVLEGSGFLIIEDTSSECFPCPQKNCESGMLARLELDGRLYGILFISMPQKFIKDEDEHRLFKELAEDITLCLGSIEKSKKIRGAEERFRIFINSTPDFMFLKDEELKYIQVNDSFLNFLNKEREEVLGKTDFELLPEGLAEQFHHSDLKILETGDRVIEEENNGDQVFEFRKFPVELSGGKIGVGGIVHDVTEIKKNEQALRESEEKYKKLVEDSHDIIYIRSFNRLLFVNDKACDITGYSREELYEKDIFELIHHDDRERVKEIAKNGLRGKKSPNTFAARIITKEGDVLYVECSFSKIVYQGNPATLGAVKDITKYRKLEQEIRKTEKLKSLGILAGGIAHDFNNLLTGILGNLSLAQLEAEGEMSKMLKEAKSASDQAKTLTQQLLTFSKGGEPVIETTSIVYPIMDSANFALRGSNVKCEYHFPQNLWKVKVDTGQISQVIQNLVINADQAMPNGGKIKIEAKNIVLRDEHTLPLDKGKYVKVIVEDKGVGIPDKHLLNIFDPYFSTKQKGSGLGLATVYSIIQNHGGYITVDSKVGLGTIFYIYLPAVEEEIGEEVEDKSATLTGQGKILLMDDEYIVREVSCRMLEKMGYNVEFASNGEEAVKKYKEALGFKEPFDVVILDLTISGGMGGKEAIKELKEIDSKVTAIVSSGYSHDTVMANYADYGFSGVLKKPYEIEDMAKVINEVIDNGD